MNLENPIGIFDSGIGGLSVLPHIQTLLPHENLIYLADQAHIPYGSRSQQEIYQFSQAITRFFISQQVKLIVIPCNTASAAALSLLRQEFPTVPFVGMEPAVKPAVQQTVSGQIGVLATASTLNSERYDGLVNRYAQQVAVWADPCVGLVELIEIGQLDSPETESYLRQRVEPMLAKGVDTIILGCTHYPFIRPLLENIIGTQVNIIDPAPAIARQTQRILAQEHLQAPKTQMAETRFITTGDAHRFSTQLQQLLTISTELETAVWQGSHLKFKTQ